MRADDLPLDALLLDPNNYRLQDESGYRSTPQERFYLEQVQRTTLQLLKAEGLKELHDSIIANGFLPIERIVVAPYVAENVDGKYLVIEGNRRVAALKQIQAEQEAGVEIPPHVLATLQAVPCVVVDQAGQDPFFVETLMGIRHVGGIRQWGGYQRAKLIADMRDRHHLDAQTVAAKLGLSTQEVNRRYRAFKALQQMRENDDFGDYAEPALYPLFHEGIAVPAVREWLSWNPETSNFENLEQLETFYRLITPTPEQDGQPSVAAKLKTFSDVRELKNVLPNADAKRILLDPERPFLEALTIANSEELSRKWRNELAEATASLRGIGALEIGDFDADDVALVDRLIETARRIREIYDRIRQE